MASGGSGWEDEACLSSAASASICVLSAAKSRDVILNPNHLTEQTHTHTKGGKCPLSSPGDRSREDEDMDRRLTNPRSARL